MKKVFPILALLTAGLLSYALYEALVVAPTEQTMGDVQRIFYYHVPSAWTAFLLFFINFLASVHGVDYYPEEPRLGVLYELLDMKNVDRITVKARVHTDAPNIRTVTDLWIGANSPEREVYDMFGVVFDGHPDMRRILMPEDYEGHPQRRDFPIGGEPVLFTHNEQTNYGQWQ